MSALSENIAVGALLVVGLIAPDQENTVIASSLIGAVIGGYLGAKVFPFDSKAKTAVASILNIGSGFCFAPWLSYYLHEKFPDIPIKYVCFPSGFVCGLAVVTLAMRLFPSFCSTIIDRLINKVAPKPKDIYPPDQS